MPIPPPPKKNRPFGSYTPPEKLKENPGLPSLQELDRKQKEDMMKTKSFLIKIVAGFSLLVGFVIAVGIYSCTRPPSFEDKYTKVCDLPGEGSIWKEVGTESEGELIWQSSMANGEPTEDDDDIYNEVLKPSKWFDGHYFYPNGRRFYIEVDGDGVHTVHMDENLLKPLGSVGRPVFLAEPIECDGLSGHPQIFQIEETLFWVRTTKDFWKNSDLSNVPEPKHRIALKRNFDVVFYNGEVHTGAAEIVGLQFVDRKAVYISRLVVEYESGTPEVEKSLYYFVWDEIKLGIECKALQGSPIKPEKDDEFVEIVKPFKVKICARELEIGLDSATKQYAEKGKMVKKRTLYFNVNGERYLAEERR